MVDSEPLSTINLPARPPTPPRESDRNESKFSLFSLDRFWKPSNSKRASGSHTSLTPDSSAESPNQLSSSTRKKVGWSNSTEYKDPPAVSFDGAGDYNHAVLPLPPSAERKPTKSILKPHNVGREQDNGIGNSKLLPPHHHATFATMLESITQQLAGTDRSSKMDAYLMLSGSLKASDNVPDVKALRQKMELLLSFIERDLKEKNDTGKPDSGLVINSLVLLSSFLHKPIIAEAITTEFSVHFADHAIRLLEDMQLSKEIVKHYMFVLAQQNFSPKIMNQERVGRLITALHEIEQKMKGKSIVQGRINIYRTLLRQSRSHMLTNTAWIEDLFSDMVSSLKDIRNPAITFGLEASFSLGSESKITRLVLHLFELEPTEGGNFAEHYSARLKAMIKTDQDSSTAVPQIWSVIVLFLRGRSRQLEQWVYMKMFLKVIEECFNSSDHPTRAQAHYAWNRFVFALQLDEKTSPGIVKMLCPPLIANLRRPKAKSLRTVTLSSIYNLLYYALKPNSTPPQLDLYWKEFVIPLVSNSMTPANVRDASEKTKLNIGHACLILQSLFDPTPPRKWSEVRAMENLQQPSIEVKELPPLDSKWLRKSSLLVFQVLAPLLEKLYWELGSESNITAVWRAYIRSIASPAVMEVKVSNDTMASLASTFSVLHKIWHTGPQNLPSLPPSIVSPPKEIPSTSAFLKSFEAIVMTTIDGLGSLPFTEKLLCIGTQGDTFVAIATPSQRPGKLRGQVKSPLHHLLSLLAQASPGLEYGGKFTRMIHRLLLPFFEARKSSKSRVELVKDLLELLPSESTEPCRIIWRVLADFASIATDARDGESSGSLDQPLGLDYRGVVKILESGINLSPAEPLPGWNTLFEALVTSATIDAGDGGRAIAVIEPLAKALLPKVSFTELSPKGSSYLHLLLGKATYPKDRQALDAARKRLWGTGSAGQKATTFDPYVVLYDYCRLLLESGYGSLMRNTLHHCTDIVSATKGLLDRCPTLLLMGTLARIQNGIEYWIMDSESKLGGGNVLSQAITSLWATVCNIVPNLMNLHTHTKVLSELEVLVCAGLESKHKTIVNSTIRLWNSTFGNSAQALEYPERVKNALLILRLVADLKLPSFPESLETEEPIDQRQPIQFAESQNDSFDLGSSLDSVFRKVGKHLDPNLDPSSMRRLRQSTPQVVVKQYKPSPPKRSGEATPDMGPRKSRKRESTPRLRHDDSQIQFQAIESSPIPDTVLESQLLTDRQKEVKARQLAEAAMFPDLRSSPISKAKSIPKTPTKDPELPLHRSSSKPHSIRSQNEPRETTPTLQMPSDDDNFITSSPTPTRSIRGEIDQSGPPSSPPESPAKQIALQDEDVPSSPPERRSALETDLIISIDPSTQMDPDALENNPAFSMFDETSDVRQASPLREPSNMVIGETDSQVSTPASEDIEQADLVPVEETVEVPEIRDPGTPTGRQEGSTTTQQTPQTPRFVDALSSPAASDNHTATDEVFEDAVSSPRLNIKMKHTVPNSSPMSGLDESSMLRVAAQYDEGPGRPERHVSFVEDKQTPSRRTRSSSANVSPQVPQSASTSVPARKSSLRKVSLAQSDGPARAEYGNEKTSSTDKIQQSSIPSLIPETPGPIAIGKKVVAEGEEFDLDDTIVVDSLILENDDEVPTIKRGKTRKKVTLSKKRKLPEAVVDQGEVPDSQDAQLATPSPNKVSPAKKKRRGRLSQISLQSDQQVETSAEPGFNSSFASVDLDTLIKAVDDTGSTADAFTSSANEAVSEKGGNVTDEERDMPSVEDEEMAEVVQATEEAAGEAISSEEGGKAGDTSFDVDIIAETTIDENSELEKSSQALVKLEIESREEVIGNASEITTDVIGVLVPIAPAETEIQSPAALEPELPTAQSMRDKLQSLIADLDTATLTREEVNAFEDLFWDAKEKLYGAGKRGRQSVDM